jgi:uncharacterized protein YhjY with autotransporter beta-barrel domain
MAQSIGGGGGNGGFSVAGGFSGKYSGNLSIGGSGGSGSSAGNVTVSSSQGAILTLGSDSFGILAQSIGGGGGNGGMALALGGTSSSNSTISANFAFGGNGGNGNTSGAVNVTNSSSISTSGSNSAGIFAQSISGGGGYGGYSLAGSFGQGGTNGKSIGLNVSVGGAGGNSTSSGTNNAAESVCVINSGAITTLGFAANGIQAQSLGGGGGMGGASLALDILASSGSPTNSAQDNTLATISVGGAGGSGNTGGTVDITNTATIITYGNSANGIFAQSVGGGGGYGGVASTYTLANNSNNNNTDYIVAIGGNGGSANCGGAVTIYNTGSISTYGVSSYGVYAQSVGGGGGNGGASETGANPLGYGYANQLQQSNQVNTNDSFNLGGNGGTNGDGGTVTVYIASGSIYTAGLNSMGIMAQSVGGGGGISQSYLSVNLTEGTNNYGYSGYLGLGGANGSEGNGGAVNVTMNGMITTISDGAMAIFAQSVGGGGGLGASAVPSVYTDNGTNYTSSVSMNFGNGYSFGQMGGGGGNGGAVTVNNNSVITTYGNYADGIFAQSVGGGGGLGTGIGTNTSSISSNPSYFAGTVGGSGNGGQVIVNQLESITTAGSLANGIFAQSAGGTNSMGGSVSVSINSGSINATGVGSSGIFAQSIGQAGNGNIKIKIASGTKVSGGAFYQPTNGPALGAGVQIMDGLNNKLTNYGIITTVNGLNGVAIYCGITTNPPATINTTIQNYGTVTGGVIMTSGGNNTFYNQSGAVLNSTNINLTTSGNFYWANGGVVALSASASANNSLNVVQLTGVMNNTGGGMFSLPQGFALGNTSISLMTFSSQAGFNSSDFSFQNLSGATFILGNNTISSYIDISADVAVNSAVAIQPDFHAHSLTLHANLDGSIPTSQILSNSLIHVSNALLLENHNLINYGTINAYGDNQVTGNSTLDNNGLIVTPTLTIAQGSTLMGVGSLSLTGGNLSVNGTFAPGNSPGTFFVSGGNLVMGSTSVWDEQIYSTSVYDRVVVTGSAILNGVMNITTDGVTQLQFGQKYNFLTASGGISGAFTSITAPEGFRGRLLLSGTQANILIAPASYTQLAANRNQSNVATALNSFIPYTSGDQLMVSTSLDSLSASEYNQAFNAIMPTFYQQIATIAFNEANALNMELNQRLWGLRIAEGGGFSMSGLADNFPILEGQGDGKGVLDSKKDILRPGLDNHWGMFVDGNGIFAQANSANMLPGYNSESGGITTGLTYKWNNNFASGLYCGYQGTYTKSGANGTGLGTGSSLIDNAVRFGVFGTYGSKDGKGLYANALAGGAYHNFQATRVIQYTGMNRTANSSPGAGELDTMLATGYDIQKGKFTFGPTASLQYTYLGVNSLNETGAQSLDFKSGGWNSSSMLSSVGAHAAYSWVANRNVVVVPQISLTWQHEFMQNPYAISGNLGETSPTFSNWSSAPIRDFLYTGVGFTVEFAKKWNTSFFYNAAAGNSDLVSQNIFWSAGVKF